MKLFPNGIELSDLDSKILAEEIDDPEAWISNFLSGKIEGVTDRIIRQWDMPIRNDNDIKSIPKDKKEYAALIMNRPYFQSKARQIKNSELLSISTFKVE